jgi:hypothetical protein
MSGQLSLLGKPTLTVERDDGTKLVLLLSITGLIAGLLTAGFDYHVGRLFRGHPALGLCILGAPFGVSLAVSLVACGVLRGFSGIWKAISPPALSAGAYFVSSMVAFNVEIALDGYHPMGQPPSEAPLSLFAGGFVGGFLVLGSILLLVHGNGRPRGLALKVLVSSVICGILGIVGRKLGPYLGIYLWSVFHDLCLTPPTETFQNALGEPSRQYSLYVVWQTGVATMLGFILQSHRPTSAR